MSDRFPLVTAAQNPEAKMVRSRFPSQRERFLMTVATVEAAHQAGSIPNPAFQDAKDTLNRAIDRAWDQIAAEYVYGRFQTLPDAVKTFWHLFNTPQLHTVPGYLKRAEKAFLNHPLRGAVIALLTEVAPLAALMADLKTKVVKREIKPSEPRQPGYHPPVVVGEAQKQVVALLETVTGKSYEALKATLVDHYQGLLTGYLEAQERATKRLTPHDHFVRRERQIPDYEARDIVESVTDSDGRGPFQAKPRTEVKKILEQKATDVADEYRNAFVHKNFIKIASVIEAKGDYDSGEVRNYHVSLAGLTGWLTFRFRDGSSFKVQNAVVYVVNQKGTRFCRYPLTFHEAILPNGKPMKNPSEERMNTIFAKAA